MLGEDIPESGPRRRRGAETALALVVTVAIIFGIAVLFLGDRSLDLEYMSRLFLGDPSAARAIPSLLAALRISLFVTALPFAAGLAIGFFVGWGRTLHAVDLTKLREAHSGLALSWALFLAGARRIFRRFGDMYVETVRGTPLLIQIVFVWSAVLILGPQEWDLVTKSLVGGLLAMTINTGGYQAEIFRGGIQTVDAGQVEAGRAVGLSRWGTLRHIVFPQTLRLAMPPLTNEFIGLFKASALLFVIGVAELNQQARAIYVFNPQVFEVFLVITVLYLMVTIPLSRAVRYMERRFAIPGLGLQGSTHRA